MATNRRTAKIESTDSDLAIPRFYYHPFNIKRRRVIKEIVGKVKGYKYKNGKYEARISHNKIHIHLGTFNTVVEAREAYAAAKLKLYVPLVKKDKVKKDRSLSRYELTDHKRAKLNSKQLKILLNYNKDTGVFTNRIKRGNALIGMKAGSIKKTGYRAITIDYESYYEHHLAWLYVYDQWPELDVDHKDVNRGNNKINNLREVTHQENHFNRTKNKNSTSGVKGAHWNTNKQRWSVRVTKNGKVYSAGYFEDLLVAEAVAELHYKNIHGKLGRL